MPTPTDEETDRVETGDDRSDATHHSGSVDTLTDPETVAERSDVAFETSSYEHESADHCEFDAAGRVVIGVRDAGRVLVRAADDRPLVLPPNTVVGGVDDRDDGGGVDGGTEPDWAAAARRVVEEEFGVDVVVDEVRTVRRVEHTVAGGDVSVDPTYHVVLGGHLVEGCSPEVAEIDGGDWHAEWLDALPESLADADGDALDDVRAFL